MLLELSSFSVPVNTCGFTPDQHHLSGISYFFTPGPDFANGSLIARSFACVSGESGAEKTPDVNAIKLCYCS